MSEAFAREPKIGDGLIALIWVYLASIARFLIDEYTERQVDKEAWERFTAPISGVDFDLLYDDLMLERRLDEDRRR